MPVAFAGKKEVPAFAKDKLKEAFGWLEGFVSGTGFIAGTSHMTLADISIYANYSTLATTEKSMVDLDEYPALKSWADKMKTLIPNHEKSNQEGVDIFREFYKTKTGLID